MVDIRNLELIRLTADVKIFKLGYEGTIDLRRSSDDTEGAGSYLPDTVGSNVDRRGFEL